MLNAEAKQFRLNDDGLIAFQPDPTNPMPGQSVARIKKGEALLRPDFDVLGPTGEAGAADPEAVAAKLRDWLDTHIKTVLEPLIALEKTEGEGVDDNVRGISARLHETLGIRKRADLEDMIGGLDQDNRRALRQRRVKLGPVLVFLPDLNKPAAVRLRALLWYIWHDKALPAAVPPDGVTSVNIAGREDINPDFYQAIGYPVYGPRAIRVDMLDRVINAIYDSAKDGQFKARHEMAEWLGCPIADLYAVLEAMGHTKIHDPADEVKPDAATVSGESPETAGQPEASQPAEQAETKEASETTVTEEAPVVAGSAEDAMAAPGVEKTPAPAAKPELATFRLRRGKAYDSRKPVRPHKPGPAQNANKDGKKAQRPFKAKGKQKPAERQPRIMSSGPERKLEDSPFAVLKQLKMNDKK